MKRIIIYLTGVFTILAVQPLHAQEAVNPLLYSYQAVQFGDINVSHDPVTLIMPGTAYAGGFSSYLDNPASAALFNRSFGEFGLVYNQVDETSHFLGNRNSFDDNQFGLSNLGFIYKFPTVRGSMVMGAGYSRHSYYNRALSINGRNDQSTMTDFFKMPGSTYEDIAFNTFAIDWADDGDYLESIFRIGFPPGDFPGITQDAEITERGYGGDFSAFFATEFLENFMVGASVGIQSGRHRYDRLFLEIDEFNDYDGAFIDSNEDGEGDTDIDTILLNDRVNSDYMSFNARVGAIYRFGDHLNLGASYTFPSVLTVDEEFDARIISTFDNGVAFEDDILTDFSYSVRAPARINLGAAIVNMGGLSASFSAEYVDYSKTRIDFEADLFEDERNENQYIRNNYTDVWNLRGGVALALTDDLTIRGGYGIRPSRFRDFDIEEQLFTGGIGFRMTENARFDIGVKYSLFDETSVLYEYEDHNFNMRSEFVDRDVNRLQVMGTLRFNFN